jgi:hypothetical protein
MKKSVKITKLNNVEVVAVVETVVTKRKGRPVDPNSPRQLRLKEIEEKKLELKKEADEKIQQFLAKFAETQINWDQVKR